MPPKYPAHLSERTALSKIDSLNPLQALDVAFDLVRDLQLCLEEQLKKKFRTCADLGYIEGLLQGVKAHLYSSYREEGHPLPEDSLLLWAWDQPNPAVSQKRISNTIP